MQRLHKWRTSTARRVSIISLLTLTTAFCTSLWAIDCDPMGMVLQTQAEVYSFQDTYGPCDRVLSLYLEGADINNLDGLSVLTDVAGSLYIQNNPVLIDIDGLSALTTVTRNLWIQNNTSLANLNGFSALTSVGDLLAIFENNALTNINGLSALTVVGGSLVIRDNAILTDVDGLSALTNIAGSERADQRFLHIENNASLVDLDGLSAVTSVGIEGSGNAVVLINGNDVLSGCNGMFRLIDQWDDAEPGPGGGVIPDVGGQVILNGNLSGCNSIDEILADIEASRINAGLNDAWYNPDTDGQGFFTNVFPGLGIVSLAWFTYDTEPPADDMTANLGDPAHRWITAVGPIVGNQVLMDIEMTSGGLFDNATEIQRTDPPGSDGTIILTFTSCNSGTVEYDIPSINRHGTVFIQRVANDNIELCEVLSAD
ncbi:MAG: hypothetical protein QNK19_12220 [Xanthomonadales bacterium]|nr:hypothetical protein [Xanthomonadales bacterium]